MSLEMTDIVNEALKSLPPRELDVLRRRVDEQQTNVEVARELGVSETVASKLFMQAKARIRRHLTASPYMKEILDGNS